MVKRTVGAGVRAVLVTWMMLLPALMVPVSGDTTQIVALLSIVAGSLVFIEYCGTMPSLVEFRAAPPFNRIRFLSLYATLFAVSQVARDPVSSTPLSGLLAEAGAAMGAALDVPFSPVRLMLILSPPEDAALFAQMQAGAGLAFGISLATVAAFILGARLLGWPVRRSAFNVWINLPLFDPTTGGDVLHRLRRDGSVNVALGCLLYVAIPATLAVLAQSGFGLDLAGGLTRIWVLSAWAFLPASFIMRGVALQRVADLIGEKRRRTYAQQDVVVPA